MVFCCASQFPSKSAWHVMVSETKDNQRVNYLECYRGPYMTSHINEPNKENYELPEFPELIFFDTNIVQNLHSFGEFIYDNHLAPEISLRISARGPRFTEDVYALADFMALGQRLGWPIAVSSKTLTELEATPRGGKGAELILWGSELFQYFTSNFDEPHSERARLYYSELTHFTFIQRLRLSELLKSLPQEADRQLIIDAMEYGCDIFLTMDYKTVWRYRDEISRFGLKVMRPVELLEYIGPWINILM